MQTAEPITQKLALYKHLKYGWFCAFQCRDDEVDPEHEDYVRATEFVTVSFPAVPPEDMVLAQVQSLDRERAEAVAKFTRVLADIDQRKAELLSITAQAAHP